MTLADSPRPDSPSAEAAGPDSLVGRTLERARRLQEQASRLITPAERRQQAELDRMLRHPADKATLVEMTDQAFRARDARRAADQLIHVLDLQGIPRFFGPVERGLLAGFQTFGGYLPGVAMPMVKDQMQRETANVVLPAEPELLKRHLDARRSEGLRMNVNHLGEALLGEAEAAHRMAGYAAMLRRPEIEVISVKASTIYSQITPIARRHTVGVLADRLEELFRVAMGETFTRADGSVTPKWLYLDMEEYRDLRLTFEAFTAALDRPGLERAVAGIVLQAYVPDSQAVQRELNAWARRRVDAGGAPITLRLVKGANMEMERVEASQRDWPQAPYASKTETDANYLRMLREGMQPENLAAVRLGVASHNLFTMAYALELAEAAGAGDRVQFEMLEGMASHQRRALAEQAPSVLLYAPACEQQEFLHAIGYLVRRLDENTGVDNYLRYAFNLRVDSDDWRRLERQFVESTRLIDTVSDAPRRRQRRGESPHSPVVPPKSVAQFTNEPDTDWSLPHHSEWAEGLLRQWEPRCGEHAEPTPLVIGGETHFDDRETRPSTDPSRPGVVVANWRLASTEDIDRAVACAASDPAGWRRRTAAERATVLGEVAERIAERRGDLLGAMLAEGAKLFTEGDPEVSEAIDFCRFYGASAADLARTPGVRAAAGGVAAVVSPWNFPLAIPCGGVAAALAAGNTVILKPASHTVLTAYHLCRCFWDAGVPREALQFAPCSGAGAGERLVTHPGVDHVILTGGTDTARRMLTAKPTMRLLAETGGKNATIVTAMADRELAIGHVLHSAFGHGGQKCSATSLLILEDEVYHDRAFRDTLVDAVTSLRVGSAWDPATRVAPLIDAPAGDLLRGLTTLADGEEWAVEPRVGVDDNPALVSPGVKWGVAAGADAHRTEYFGPVLAVMRAGNLHEAIDLVNATGYGLTSGLESLDDREHTLWRERVRAGNLYLNRSTTGAIVLRQPFGGVGLSAVGPGIKAGGPNYVVPLMRFEPAESHSRTGAPADGPVTSLIRSLRDSGVLKPEESERLLGAQESYTLAARDEFLAEHDHFHLVGQDNLHRYRSFQQTLIRLHAEDTPFDVLARVAAAHALGSRAVLSSPPDAPEPLRRLVEAIDAATGDWAGDIEFAVQTDEQLAEAVPDRGLRVRYADPSRVPEPIRLAAAESLAYLADAPVSDIGRLELVWYVQEQSVSHDYHRYGNLGRRA